MILIISENDQIIGSDEEFLNGDSLETLKENFPSLSLFALQSESVENVFDFEYNSILYIVNKHKIVIDSENAYLYLFAKSDSQIDKNDHDEKAILPVNENPIELGLEPIKDEIQNEPEQPKQDSNDLDLGFDEPEAQTSTTEPELDLDLGTTSEEPKEEASLELGLDSEPEQPKQDSNDDEELPFKISKEEIQKDLEQASKDLGIDTDMLMEFFNDFKQQLLDEKDTFLTAIANNDYETLHKSAHKLKGVALNLRLTKCGDLLRTTDDLSKQQEDLTKISKLLNTIYASLTDRPILENIDSVNEDVDNTVLELDKELSLKDKKVLFKTLYDFVESIKSLDESSLKEQLKAAYALVPLKSLNQLDDIEDINEFVDKLQKSLRKEIE